MPKLFETKSTKSTNTDSNKKKVGRPKKVISEDAVKDTNKKSTKKIEKVPNTKNNKSKSVSSAPKNTKTTKTIKEPIKKNTKQTEVVNVQRRWHNFITNPPELERPIEFNSNYKKPIYGYRTYQGIITNTPYYIDKYKKETGNIEWQYINSCKDLSKCPNGFPNCDICDIAKKLLKIK